MLTSLSRPTPSFVESFTAHTRWLRDESSRSQGSIRLSVEKDSHIRLDTTTARVRNLLRPKVFALDISLFFKKASSFRKNNLLSQLQDMFSELEIFRVQQFFKSLKLIWNFLNLLIIFAEIPNCHLKNFINFGIDQNFRHLRKNFAAYAQFFAFNRKHTKILGRTLTKLIQNKIIRKFLPFSRKKNRVIS